MLVAGGSPPPSYVASTEAWDGTCWTEVADLAAVKAYSGGAGTASAMISYAGTSPPYIMTTEEWNATGSAIKTFTAS